MYSMLYRLSLIQFIMLVLISLMPNQFRFRCLPYLYYPGRPNITQLLHCLWQFLPNLFMMIMNTMTNLWLRHQDMVHQLHLPHRHMVQHLLHLLMVLLLLLHLNPCMHPLNLPMYHLPQSHMHHLRLLLLVMVLLNLVMAHPNQVMDPLNQAMLHLHLRSQVMGHQSQHMELLHLLSQAMEPRHRLHHQSQVMDLHLHHPRRHMVHHLPNQAMDPLLLRHCQLIIQPQLPCP